MFDYLRRQTIFLTGASGILGARVLLHLLSTTECKVICLMRGEDLESASSRLESAVKVYDPQFHLGGVTGRVTTLLGDVAQDHLGLDADDYQDLTESVSTVIHAAASVNFTALYSSIVKTNVEGTEQVARLALDADAGMIHVSSYSVIGDAVFRPGFVFKEDDCDVGQGFGGFAYGRTKFEAELILREMGPLRWIILRSGDIYGDSRTGAYPLHTPGRPAFFYDIFKTAIETGLCPFREDLFDITPVDLLAQVIVHLTLEQDSWGQTFHLMNPRPRRFFEVMNHLIDHGYRLKALPFDEYVELFRKGLSFKDGKKYSSQFTAMSSLFFKHFFQQTRAHFDTQEAERLYEKAGIIFPKTDYSLLDVYLRFCQGVDYLPPPRGQTLATVEEPLFGRNPTRIVSKSGSG